MIKRTLGCVALFGWLVASTGLLQAHHSLAGVYDMKNDKEMSGTVASIKFTNPHGSLTLAVKNRRWHVNRLGDDNGLRDGARAARNRQDRRERPPQRRRHQDQVPAREGRQSAGLSPAVTMPDGHVIKIAAPNATE